MLYTGGKNGVGFTLKRFHSEIDCELTSNYE